MQSACHSPYPPCFITVNDTINSGVNSNEYTNSVVCSNYTLNKLKCYSILDWSNCPTSTRASCLGIMSACSVNKVMWLRIIPANDLKDISAVARLLNSGGAHSVQFLL